MSGFTDFGYRVWMGKLAAVATAVAHTPGTWRLLYFDAPNRGEQVRQLFVLAGTPFVDVRLKYPEGLNPYKKAALGDASPLLGTDLCPAVTAPDGTHCVETADMMRFVGQRLGLAPSPDSPSDAKAMELTLLAQHTMNTVFYPLLKPMIVRHIFETEVFGLFSWVSRALVGKESTYLETPSLKLEEAMQSFELALEVGGGPYVCGAELSYADVSIFAILNEVLAFKCFGKARLQPYPRLGSLLAELEGRTQLWVDHRVREHQLSLHNTVEFFACTNTPFPWSRRRPLPRARMDFSWPAEGASPS